MLDPDTHSILRPFGFIEDRFYIIRQECGTVMAWHVANLRGPHAQRMIDEMWEQLALQRNLPVEQAKRLEKIHWDAADFPRCPHCGAPPPHPQHIPKGAGTLFRQTPMLTHHNKLAITSTTTVYTSPLAAARNQVTAEHYSRSTTKRKRRRSRNCNSLRGRSRTWLRKRRWG